MRSNASFTPQWPALLATLIMGSVHAPAWSQQPTAARQQSFVRALDMFDKATSPDDYRECARELESILADGFRNGAIYYNLGNAYFRAGEYGRAILNYRKALPFRPRDPYLSANLQQAIAQSPGRLPAPSKPWWIHVLFWNSWFAFPTKVYFGFATLCMSSLALWAGIAFSRPYIHWLTGMLIGLTLMNAIDIASAYPDINGIDRAVIVAETIARKGTGNSYEPAFDQPLRDGAEFRVLDQTAGWTLGRFEGIGDGWVRNEHVAR